MRIFDTDGDGQISLAEFSDLLRFCVLMTTVEGSTAAEEDDAVATVNLAKMQVDEVRRQECKARPTSKRKKEELWAVGGQANT